MLWSPSEVLAYMKDDKTIEEEVNKRENDRLVPTAPFGGFQTWPSSKEDFIFIAENSEIHGPNPLFTIPKLNSEVDLNLLSTQILSADYQGLSNNKILPGKNAQLLMPDIAADTHAAIIYFFLFDSDARGFVRPTCIAYFTSDKHKLIQLAKPILRKLTEAASILQHSNILHSSNDLKTLKETIVSSGEMKLSKSQEVVTESLLKDVQEVLDIIEGYEGNSYYDKQLSCLIGILEQNSLSDEIKNFIATSPRKNLPESHNHKLSCRPNSKRNMKDLYQICDKGIIFCLYHLFLTYKHFRRKYEYIDLSENCENKNENYLLFGACVKTANRKCDILPQNKCALRINRVPVIHSLYDENYLKCVNAEFEKVLLRFMNWEKEFECLTECSYSDHTNSHESGSSKSTSSGYLSNEYDWESNSTQESCSHIVPLDIIWDILEHFQFQYPGIEKTFLRILKHFDNSQKIMFSILTRSPIVVISAYHQLEEAVNFILALSIFIPRNEKEILFVDKNRLEPLTTSDFSTFVAVNICLDDHCTVERFIPLDYVEKMCILNLKDGSLTAPSYTGCLLADLDERIRILPAEGSLFAVLVCLLAEIEYSLNWWHMVTTSSVGASEASAYVLSKGYTRSDMQIIEKLYELWKRKI